MQLNHQPHPAADAVYYLIGRLDVEPDDDIDVVICGLIEETQEMLPLSVA